MAGVELGTCSLVRLCHVLGVVAAHLDFCRDVFGAEITDLVGTSAEVVSRRSWLRTARARAGLGAIDCRYALHVIESGFART